MTRLRTAVVALALGLIGGCSSSGSARSRPDHPRGTSGVQFVYASVDGDELSSATTRGRATAVLFVTTFDLASQLMARRLDGIVRRHTPRANAAAIVLEPPKYIVMARGFQSALQLSYPIAMADEWERRVTPFGHIDRVPTLVVLDRSGVETERFHGVVPEARVEAALASASKRGSPFAL